MGIGFFEQDGDIFRIPTLYQAGINIVDPSNKTLKQAV
jgi:hypothetical protein